ncbi:MAG: EamA family transporter [Oscillospiraceae bacterium]|nr:EamA family transporter [Oscillospiraceae bacterium]
MHKLSPRSRIILSMLIFGTIGVFRRWIPWPSSAVALTRSVIGLLFLLGLRALRREPIDRRAVRRNLGKLLLLGAMLGTNWIFLFEAYNYTSVAAATMCYYMAPVLILLASPLFGEPLTLRKGLCAAAAVFGMVLVSGVLSGGLHGAKGLLFGLIAACLYAAIVLLNRTLRDISAGDRTIMQFAACAAVMLPYVLLTEDVRALPLSPRIVLLLLAVGIVHTGLAYVWYFGGIAGVPAQSAALLSYLDPVAAVLLSVTLLHEPMTLPAALGAALVLGAMAVNELEPRGRETDCRTGVRTGSQ